MIHTNGDMCHECYQPKNDFKSIANQSPMKSVGYSIIIKMCV